jgi:DNA polymerase/3'-5' exonuclease PolX
MYDVSIHLPNDKNIDEEELISIIKNHCNKLKIIKSLEYTNSIENLKENITYSLELNIPNISHEKVDIIQTILKTRYHIKLEPCPQLVLVESKLSCE